MNYRYDKNPQFFDEQGYMWTDWMFRHFVALNEIQDRTETQNKEIDMIFEAASKGRTALNELEKKLKKNNSL